jgi:hypothetical protein
MTMAAAGSVALPAGGDVEAFIDSVDDVARLIACLKEGTITPEYVDNKLEQRAKDEQRKSEKAASARPDVKPVSDGTSGDEARQEDLRRKVEAIRESLERKRKARERYQAYVASSGGHASSQTDYNKWDMWCPSDDEDDMIKSLTPNSPEFRSMEKDIDERHERCPPAPSVLPSCTHPPRPHHDLSAYARPCLTMGFAGWCSSGRSRRGSG